LPEKQRLIELHGGADDETPTEARIAGPVANANASKYGGEPSQSQPSAGTSSDTKYSENDITTLTNLGVSRQEAIHALDMAGGNCEIAASLLFQN
jgi:NACalpha-BTF3-like transcription factor